MDVPTSRRLAVRPQYVEFDRAATASSPATTSRSAIATSVSDDDQHRDECELGRERTWEPGLALLDLDNKLRPVIPARPWRRTAPRHRGPSPFRPAGMVRRSLAPWRRTAPQHRRPSPFRPAGTHCLMPSARHGTSFVRSSSTRLGASCSRVHSRSRVAWSRCPRHCRSTSASLADCCCSRWRILGRSWADHWISVDVELGADPAGREPQLEPGA